MLKYWVGDFKHAIADGLKTSGENALSWKNSGKSNLTPPPPPPPRQSPGNGPTHWLPRCQGNPVNVTFCGPARDTLLSNRKTEKLNFGLSGLT